RLAAAIGTRQQQPALWLLCICDTGIKGAMQVDRPVAREVAWFRNEGTKCQAAEDAQGRQLLQRPHPSLAPLLGAALAVHGFAKVRMAKWQVGHDEPQPL